VTRPAPAPRRDPPRRPVPGNLLLPGILLFVLVLLGTSCSTATRERILAALFDDPPPTAEERAAAALRERAAPEDRAKRDEARSVPRRRPRIRFEGSRHGPWAARACSACHLGPGEGGAVPGDVARLRAPRTRLCARCHDRSLLVDLREVPAAARHGPLRAGACLGCHTPHSSRNPFLVRGPAGKPCARCHRVRDLGPDHPEADQGSCTECHDAHAPLEGLLP